MTHREATCAIHHKPVGRVPMDAIAIENDGKVLGEPDFQYVDTDAGEVCGGVEYRCQAW